MGSVTNVMFLAIANSIADIPLTRRQPRYKIQNLQTLH